MRRAIVLILSAAVLSAEAATLIPKSVVKPVNVARAPAATGTVAKDTAAVQGAIDAAFRAGGGRAVVPAGTYRIGTIWLKSNVELHLEEGATLLASDRLSDYNAADAYPQNWGCRNEGWREQHLVIAHEATNVALTGKGVIDGNGRAFFEPYRPNGPKGDFTWRRGYCNAKSGRKAAVRPGQELVFVECRGVRVEGVTIRDSACWTCFFHGCEDVTVRGVTIRNPMWNANTDGFDIDSCRHVRVSDCDVETGDDVFALRGSPAHLKNAAAVLDDVVISNCVGACAASGVRVGLGNGRIGNVLVKNVRFREAGHGLLVQTCYPEAPAHAGVTIDGVVFEDIEIDDSAHPILVTAGTKDAEKALANVVFRNIRAKAVGSIVVEGAGRTRPRDVRFENVDLTLVPRTRPRAETRDWEVVGQSNTNGAAVCVEQADGVVFRAMRIRRDAGYMGPYDMKGRDVDYSVLDASVDR